MSLTIVYALEDPPASFAKSIFLAGPTPRDIGVLSWRPKAIQHLEECGYDGVVFVPESRDGIWHRQWTPQAEWEDCYLNMADCILFWIPRDPVIMPALTTNDEWGVWKNSGKVTLGCPEGAYRVRYQQHYADRLYVPSAATLQDAIDLAINMLQAGALRTGGEREVPLHIWRTESFQRWYAALKKAGNRLEHAKVHWAFRTGPDKKTIFLWVMHVEVYIGLEKRSKVNEFVIGRPDISTIVMYRRAPKLDDSTVVLVREFRSPVANDTGYVWEAAGGSSTKPGGNPLQLAADEVHEETGLSISPYRFVAHEVRQMVSTLLAHKAHLFSVELTQDEIEQFIAQTGQVHGVIEDSERTYVEVLTLGQIRQSTIVDWSMLGMIMQVLTT